MNGEIIGKELCLGVSSAALVSFSQFVPCYVYVRVCVYLITFPLKTQMIFFFFFGILNLFFLFLFVF